MMRSSMNQLAVVFEQTRDRSTAQLSRMANDQVEHGLGVARCGRHCLQHFGCGRLVSDPLTIIAAADCKLAGSLGECSGQRVTFGPQCCDDSIWVCCCLIWWRDHLPPGAGFARAGIGRTGYQLIAKVSSSERRLE
jgi:hypothetical protein